MTDISPENVKRMLDGVTPGPWRAQPHDDEDTAAMFWYVFGDGIILEIDEGEDGCVTTAVGSGTNDRPARNARFIAWAREAVPALSAERDALSARLAEVELNAAYMRTVSEIHRTRAEAAEAHTAREVAKALTAVQDEVQKLRREAGRSADGVRFQALDDVRNLIKPMIPTAAKACA